MARRSGQTSLVYRLGPFSVVKKFTTNVPIAPPTAVTRDLVAAARFDLLKKKRWPRFRRSAARRRSFPMFFSPTLPAAILNPRIKFLFSKKLQRSDVGVLKRIILPKKPTETLLPKLPTKEGMVLEVDDLDGINMWFFKFRYWPNNNSRMYVLEGTGEFAEEHNLQFGDYIMMYRDTQNLTYVIQGLKACHVQQMEKEVDAAKRKGKRATQSGAMKTVPGTSGLISQTILEGTPVLTTPSNGFMSQSFLVGTPVQTTPNDSGFMGQNYPDSTPVQPIDTSFTGQNYPDSTPLQATPVEPTETGFMSQTDQDSTPVNAIPDTTGFMSPDYPWDQEVELVNPLDQHMNDKDAFIYETTSSYETLSPLNCWDGYHPSVQSSYTIDPLDDSIDELFE